MRKVTGYIGALIIVFALMGSILAGYALNINGQSVVVNEYENVTDVSGLYSHTDQKTYIDYNPASNYIGYKTKDRYTNTPASNALTFKKMVSGDVITINNRTITFNGVSQGNYPSVGTVYKECFFSQYAFVSTNDNLSYWVLDVGYPYTWTSIYTNDLTITIVNDTLSITGTDTNNNPLNYTFTSEYQLSWYTDSDYDYNYNRIYGGGEVNAVIPSYCSDDWPIYGYSIGAGRFTTSNNTISNSEAYAIWDDSLITFSNVNGAYHTDNANYNGVQGIMCYHLLYPRYIYYDLSSTSGIDYTESNRVNNYIVGYRNIGGTPVTTSSRLDLQNVSTTNYATPNKEWIIGSTMDGGDIYGNNPDLNTQFKTGPVYSSSGSGYAKTGSYKVYKFTDILTSISLPQNATVVTMKVPVITGSMQDGTIPVRYTSGSNTYYRAIPYNMVVIGNYAGTYDYEVCGTDTEVLSPGRPMLPNNTNIYRTATYDVSTGLVTIYDQHGARVLMDNVNNIYIQFVSNPGNYGLYEWYNTNSVAQGVGHSYFQQTPIANLDIDITTTSSTSTPIYMDITKGIKIDPSNISNTVWTNDYENGIIKVLFRAEDTYSTYHNELIVSGNTVSVDYTGGRFFITLNSGEPVDIGTWRNIVINLDLLAGRVTVNPVRTFNSYTNVTMDRAVIDVGDLVSVTPTTTIEWKPTANSFKFNIYSTDVFLDTYGVVMVNPSLNITNQFTNLNNFYRLDLYNFSTYGDSITVNGVTGTVSRNTVTFDDKSFMLKDFSIIYADGHAYIEDGHETIDLGEITTNDISLSGVWYFETELSSGYTDLKQIYTWDWEEFIFDNTQFCVIYILLALAGLVIARRFCTLSIIDYVTFITSIVIALGIQVIA